MIDAAAQMGHYAAHILPVWRALPPELRGDIYAPNTIPGLPGALSLSKAGKDPDRLTIVAGHPDLSRMRSRTGVMLEHGAGQSYGASRESARHPAHPGGDRRDKARLFLMPNEQSAARDRARYPDARVEVIGSPRLAELQQLPLAPVGAKPVVAFAWHWGASLTKESGGAWSHWIKAVQTLVESDRYEVIGTAHPRVWNAMERQYRRMGIEPVQRTEDIITRANVVCFDNTSFGFEAAGVGLPVVVLDAPWWRQSVNHGGRFWDWADVGPRILLPEALPNAIESALNKRPWPGAERILADIYPAIENPAAYAAELIADEYSRMPKHAHAG